jgi:hypothetical protein
MGVATGDSGVVTVRHRGRLDTSGDGAFGILAQSIGGGGGLAGDFSRGIGKFGKDTTFSGAGGGSGQGGGVTVTSDGVITTHGAGAVGIFAQSVGGGGGIAGGAGGGFAGSVGGAGSANAVTVTHTGEITTVGDYSHGIVAQSAGGTGVGSAVSVTLAGAIAVNGKNASGIVAQSRGDGGGGKLTVTISDASSVLGGSWDGVDPQARPAAVRFLDGAENRLTNSGTVGAHGRVAVLGAAGNETVDNFGALAGTVDLGSGINALHNHPEAFLETADVVHVGEGNSFINEGHLSLDHSIGHTELVGNFVQTHMGTLSIELAGTTPHAEFDDLAVTGTATLAGTLDVLTVDGFAPTMPGETFTVISANARDGSFDRIVGTPSATLPGLFWTLDYTSTSVILSTSAIPGDINLDGDVDRRDASLFSQYFGTSAGADWASGDFNGDGKTALADLAILQAHFGQSVPNPIASAAAVPEPSTLLTLSSAIFSVVLIRLSHRRLNRL